MLSCLFVPPYLPLVTEDAYQRMISEKKKRKKERIVSAEVNP